MYHLRGDLNIRKIYNHFCKAGDTIFDVGAHNGKHTLRETKDISDINWDKNSLELKSMYQIIEKNGAVYAFEPSTKYYKILKKNALKKDINSEKIKTINAVVSNQNGKIKFLNNKERPGQSSVVKRGGENCTYNEEIVNQIKLDNYINTIENLTFIKIDVEGFEYKVLLGAVKLIKKFNPIIIFEYSDLNSKILKINTHQEMFNYFKDLDYTIISLDGDICDTLEEFKDCCKRKTFEGYDYVSIPNKFKISEKFTNFLNLIKYSSQPIEK